jgi:hypothetical protein
MDDQILFEISIISNTITFLWMVRKCPSRMSSDVLHSDKAPLNLMGPTSLSTLLSNEGKLDVKLFLKGLGDEHTACNTLFVLVCLQIATSCQGYRPTYQMWTAIFIILP